MVWDNCEYRDARLAFWTEGWYDDGEDEVVEANVQISQDRPLPPGAKLSRLLVPPLPAPASRGQKCTNIFSWSHACRVAAAHCRGLIVLDSDGGIAGAGVRARVRHPSARLAISVRAR